MKKFLILFAVVFMGIVNVKALDIEVYEENEKAEVITYTRPVFEDKNSYYMGLNNRPYTRNDMETWYFNNLAFIGDTYNDEIYQAVVQIMIWENLYANLDFKLKVNDEYLDLKEYEEKILTKLYSYNLINSLDGISIIQNYGYDAGVGGIQDIDGFITLSNLGYVDHTTHITFYTSTTPGPATATFYYNLQVYSNQFWATKIVTKPFTITLRVTNPIYSVDIKSYEYLNETEYIETNTKVLVNFTNLESYWPYRVESNRIQDMEQGRYAYIDYLTGEEGYLTITSNTKFYMKHYLITGIKLDEAIDSIIIDKKEYQVSYVSGINYLEEPIIAGIHHIVINGLEYDLNLLDQTKIVLENNRYMYVWDLPYEVKEEEDMDTSIEPSTPSVSEEETVSDLNPTEEENIDEIIIAVPNTNIDIPKVVLYYEKKKYITNIINYN